jgi:hypothetical protein
VESRRRHPHDLQSMLEGQASQCVLRDTCLEILMWQCTSQPRATVNVKSVETVQERTTSTTSFLWHTLLAEGEHVAGEPLSDRHDDELTCRNGLIREGLSAARAASIWVSRASARSSRLRCSAMYDERSSSKRDDAFVSAILFASSPVIFRLYTILLGAANIIINEEKREKE